MLKELVYCINTSALEDINLAYKLVAFHFPKVSLIELKKYFKKTNLEEYGLKEGTIFKRLEDLRGELKKNNLDAYLLSTNDEYLSEYTPTFAKRLFYITGFSGSYGFFIITKYKAAIFIDGRYTHQAKKQVDTTLIEVLPLSYNKIITYINENLQKSEVIGLNSKTFSYSFCNYLFKELEKDKLELKLLNNDLVDNIWYNQPPKPISPVTIYDTKYSGESTKDKIHKITNYLAKENLDALLITPLDSIAWLLNLRGADIEFSPLNLARLIIYNNGEIDLFINKLKLLPQVTEFLKENNINCYNSNEIIIRLQELKGKKIGLNVESPYFYYQELKDIAKVKLLKNNLVNNLKSIKNSVEQNNSKVAHYKDGVALTKLILWLNKEIKKPLDLTEINISNKIDEIKSEIKGYQGNSFASIVAADINAAFPHYSVTEKSNRKISKNSILLIDAGGQYLEGTTDVSRTLSFKSPSNDFKYYFTLVLKGLIALSKLKFPIGTPCCNIDTIARQFLWQIGLDYNHGTGHGVGHYLSVHEEPIRLNQSCQEPLKEGMILSIEPGYYKENHFGIRIENLVLTKKSSSHPNFLEFITLTYVPIDIKNIDFSMLTNDEKNWLKVYHKDLLNNLSNYLTQDELKELLELIKNYLIY